MATVRERLWLFGIPILEQTSCNWAPPGYRMTAAEGALYLGIPNVVYVVQKDLPAPPFDSYARALAPFQQQVWSILGDSLATRDDLEEVIRLAGRFPNVTGGMMDDFFRWPGKDGPVGRYSVEEVRRRRDALHGADRRLDLWVVIYVNQLDLASEPYLELCDVVTLWSWWARELPDLEANFAAFERRAGEKRKVLGCYLADVGDSRPMPLELMQHQCQLGLRWMQEGRLDGMIFLGNPVSALGLEAVEWTRDWIAEVGPQPL